MKPDTTTTNPHQERIDHEAERILKEIKGGQLYGQPIDPNNTNQLVYAAYLIGLYGHPDTPRWRPIL